MGNSVFSRWFKEFATLVFTQTVQAFLLAIVMTIIVSCLAEADGNGSSANAAGLLCIIALASFNKIELLVKQIFGVTSQFGPSLDNGARSLMTAGLALRGAKKISDNAGKIMDGARDMKLGKAGMDAVNAGNGDKKALDSLNNSNGIDEETKEEVANQVQDQVVKLQTIGDIGQLTEAINNLSKDMQRSNKSDMQSKAKEYEDKYNEGRMKMKTGISETIGAIGGMNAGAIYGMAKGENVMGNALAGAGIGDDLGASLSNRSEKKRSYNKEMEKIKDMGKDNIKAANDQAQKAIEQAAKSKNQEVEDFIRENDEQINKALESYQKSIQENMQNVINKATRKPQAASKSYKELKKSYKELKNIQIKIDKNSNAGDSK